MFTGLEAQVRENEPLGPMTWLGIGGPARYFIEPATAEALKQAALRCRENGLGVFVLGGGANLLIDDAGVKGAVIRLNGPEFARISICEGQIRAGAYFDMGKLVLRCVREGLSGLEALTGIPGTVGGCVRMNAGGAFGDIASAIKTVQIMTSDGEIFTRLREDMAFGYRSSNIAGKFILSAEFQLSEDDPHRILKQVKEIWMFKKNTQPLSKSTAGCTFKNPRGMSAGALIDRAGLKGRRVGGACVSERHANFIIADEGTTAADVLKLINVIRDTVHEKSGVYLELEIEVW